MSHLNSPMAMGGKPSPDQEREPDPLWGKTLADYIREDGTDPDILAAFKDFCDSGIPRVPEPVFKEHLLPLSYPEEGVTKDVLVWRRILGSFTNPLYVVNERDQVLLTVPGLHPEMPLYEDENGQKLRWAALTDDAIRRNNAHPGYGSEKLVAIGSRYLPDISSEEAKAHLQKWIVIWQHYGVNGYEPKTDNPKQLLGPGASPTQALDALEEEDEI